MTDTFQAEAEGPTREFAEQQCDSQAGQYYGPNVNYRRTDTHAEAGGVLMNGKVSHWIVTAQYSN